VRDDDDDVSDEGTPLPGNPALREVVPAGVGDRTSMIDLEAVEAKRAARRAEADARSAGASAFSDEPSATAARQGQLERDVDATGTLARKPRKGATAASRLVRDEQAEAQVEEPAASVDGADEVVGGGTRTGMTRTGMTRAGQTVAGGTHALKRPPPQRKPLSPAGAAAVVAIVIVVVIVGVFFAARATGVLTVTTVPLGARVTLDGEPIGTSPIQKRVRTGSHMVELTLDGFEPFREVVTVPSEGLAFLQPLKALPPPPPPPPTPAELATDLAAQAKRLFDAGDLDGAAARIAELEALVPDHQPSRELRTAIKAALDKRAQLAAQQKLSAAAEARVIRARQLADEGLRLYGAGKLGPARTALYESLKLDPKSPDPHRSLAKIFNREDDVEKVRYHLERFLDLGGNDGDFKVREWLKAHPK
jgi:hypothetical protein